MTAAESFPFLERDPRLGLASMAPMLPITLVGSAPVSVSALLDTGATVNVLPYSVGGNWVQSGISKRFRWS